MKYQSAIPLLILTAVSVFLFSSCSQSDAQAEKQPAGASKDDAVTVSIEEIQPSRFVDALQVAGTVKAYQDVMLSPEEGGVIKEWVAQKGERLKKGTLIAILKDDVLQASYDAALAQYKLAELNYSKQEKVYSEQAISELQLKNSEFGRDAAKAQMDLAKARLERAHLRSPIEGILDDRYREIGEFAPSAVPVAHIVSIGQVKIMAEVSEREVSTVILGTPAIVTFDAFPGDTLRGQVRFVGATVSASNRALPVEIHLQNPNLKIKPDMVAKVTLLRSVRSNAILLAEEIVQKVDRNRLIVYVENNGKAEERAVKLGNRQGDLVEIVGGLKIGDRVITSGYQRLVHGQAVHVNG